MSMLGYIKKYRLNEISKGDRLNIITISIAYVIMGCIAYWVNPVNNLLSTILVCSLSSLISSIFYLKGIDRGIKLTQEARQTAVEDRLTKIQRAKAAKELTKLNVENYKKRKNR